MIKAACALALGIRLLFFSQEVQTIQWNLITLDLTYMSLR